MAAKLILNKPKYSSATKALQELEWKHLDYRRHLHLFFFIFRFLHEIIDFNNNNFNINLIFNIRQSNAIHHYNTCKCKNLRLSAPKTNSILTFKVMKYRKLNLVYFLKRNLFPCFNFIVFYLYHIFSFK